jgi:hypothetical protein
MKRRRNKEKVAVRAMVKGYCRLNLKRTAGRLPGTNPIHASKARDRQPAASKRTDENCSVVFMAEESIAPALMRFSQNESAAARGTWVPWPAHATWSEAIFCAVPKF